jgi:hypothetical protein
VGVHLAGYKRVNPAVTLHGHFWKKTPVHIDLFLTVNEALRHYALPSVGNEFNRPRW